MPRATGEAPGKWILFGEHTVVTGASAVAFPLLSHTVRVAASLGEGRPGVRLAARDPGGRVLRLVVRCLGPRLRDLPGTLSLAIGSILPAGVGLGSSAALVVAMGRALAALGLVEDHPPLDRLRDLERVFHLEPSGLDPAVAAAGCPILFQPPGTITLLDVPAPPVLLVLSGETRATARTQSSVPDLRPFVEASREITRDGLGLLREGDIEGVGRAMDQNQRLLEQLGVVSPGQARLVSQARELGAWGAKITGAGGGGAVLVLHPRPGFATTWFRSRGRVVIPASVEEP